MTSTPASRSARATDRKSTRLNSSHCRISYAVFCLKKKEHTSELQSLTNIVCRLLLEIINTFFFFFFFFFFFILFIFLSLLYSFCLCILLFSCHTSISNVTIYLLLTCQ